MRFQHQTVYITVYNNVYITMYIFIQLHLQYSNQNAKFYSELLYAHFLLPSILISFSIQQNAKINSVQSKQKYMKLLIIYHLHKTCLEN